MITKAELQDQLVNQQTELARLRHENECLRTVLYTIYNQTRGALGIEAAIQVKAEELEAQRRTIQDIKDALASEQPS